MSKIEVLPRVATLAFWCAIVSCTSAETHVELPTPVPIVQWALKVDTLPGTYTAPGWLAEFLDSVVVISDVKEQTAWRIDLVSGTRSTFGSQGGGPGEYATWPGLPLKVGSDSVALVVGNAHTPFPILSVRTGRGRTHKIPTPSPGADRNAIMQRVTLPFLDYADTLGNFYGAHAISVARIDTTKGRRAPVSVTMLDTLSIVRVSMSTGRHDTLVRLPRGVLAGERKVDANGATVQSVMELGPYGAVNGWVATADGQVLTTNSANYELNIFDHDGNATQKWKLSSNAVPVSEKAWNVYVDKATNGAATAIAKMQKEVFAKVGVAPPPQPMNRYVIPEMPKTLPPIQLGEGWRRIHVVGNIAWIPVSRVDPPTGNHWDLVDLTTGKRIETIVFPDKQYLRGVSRLGAYVYAIDDDDLQRVLLYRRRARIDSTVAAGKN